MIDSNAHNVTDWKQILLICQHALTLDTGERGPFLEAACQDNPALRRDIFAMMEATVDSESLFGSLLTRFDQLFGSTGNIDAACPTAFRSSPFVSLAPETLSSLLAAMQPCEYAEGELLIQQGDAADYLLLIVTGAAIAQLRSAPPDRPPVGEFGPGDVVGEMALITQAPRTADVVALTSIRALRLSSVEFDRLVLRYPDLRVVLTNVVADRLGRARYDGLGDKTIQGYRIMHCVGRGGMGVVYEAQRVADGVSVALKMMNHRLIYDTGAMRRFHREASLLKTLRHPSLAQVYECFSAYKTEFLAMEFCHGTPLNQLLVAGRRFKEPVVRRLIGQLAVALAYVHARGVIHRDVKPSNIIITRDGIMKLLDFGIVIFEPAAAISRDVDGGPPSRAGAVLGTPRYMAPEQFSGSVDKRVDYYGLACIAFEALAGEPVIQSGDMFSVLREQAVFTLPPPEAIGGGISAEMHEILARGLDPRPEQRNLDLERLAGWAAPILPHT